MCISLIDKGQGKGCCHQGMYNSDMSGTAVSLELAEEPNVAGCVAGAGAPTILQTTTKCFGYNCQKSFEE